MNYKRAIKKTISHIPPARGYVQRLRVLRHEIEIQANHIKGLEESVGRLEERNKQWEAEVRSMRGDARSLKILWPVFEKDLIQANWLDQQRQPHRSKRLPPFTINWVVPPMGPVSGGHADIFRTIHFLESREHICRIYFYDALRQSSLKEIKENLKHYHPLKAAIFYNQNDMDDCDALFATNWYTAYPVFNYAHPTKKFYFIQDFEPYFEPVGTYSTLAENTYKFGLHGITLGPWLARKLQQEFAMQCDSFDLGVDTSEYYLSNPKPRKKVLFYARPVTPRRGFELGVLALKVFHEKHPEFEINFLGWDTAAYDIPFPYVNHGILTPNVLNNLYNECAAGLVLSFTNMSLLPLEMLACGCLPVMNDALHTRSVNYSDKMRYAEPNPTALTDALYQAIQDAQNTKVIKGLAEYAKSFEWSDSNQKIEKLLLDQLS